MSCSKKRYRNINRKRLPSAVHEKKKPEYERKEVNTLDDLPKIK